MRANLAAFAAIATLACNVMTSEAADNDVTSIHAEIKHLSETYETRIAELESRLEKIETTEGKTVSGEGGSASSAAKNRRIFDNTFNPSIGVILNGRYSEFSSTGSEIAGFAVGEEGERGREGLAIDESEINFSASVDDKFYSSLTAAIVREDGEDKIELEEAYAQTMPGFSLPNGFSAKAGRAFWTIGYLNEHHAHADDFADRPLPYRVFLNKSFNDDGVEFSYILPTDLFAEIGGGLFRGDDFPLGNADGEIFRQWSSYARVGGDIGYDQSWRLGGYVLSGEAKGGRASNESTVTFTGDTQIYVTDLRYTWAPGGNSRQKEVIFQGEYFWRNESGTYEDTNSATGTVNFDDASSGWYAQAVYKLNPRWRVGARYSRLEAPNAPVGLVGSALDSSGHEPVAYASMVDWTNSEFSRLRFQFNHEKLSAGQNDNQFIAQYVMSFGAHGAHKY